MKIVVDISPEHYDRILNEFSEEPRMYAILKNGLVLHRFEAGNEFRTVEILCEKFHARMILAAARCAVLKRLLRSKKRSDFPAHCTETNPQGYPRNRPTVLSKRRESFVPNWLTGI